MPPWWSSSGEDTTKSLLPVITQSTISTLPLLLSLLSSSLPFSSLSSFVSSYHTLWHAGIQFDGNGEMDWWSIPCCFWQGVMILLSLFPGARMYSISVSNVYSRLEGSPQIGHPTQTKKAHWFADPELPVACWLPSSTPNRPSTSFILLLIRLQAALPPILSTCCFGIGACPLNFAWAVERL